MEIRYELFKGVNESFSRHIDIPDNRRILFSGRFGIGKTTFLNEYFKNFGSHNVIHLYPVNYSILSNEDIFSYLKYDILVELFSNEEYPLKPDYYSFLEGWDDFLTDNLSQVIATALLLIPKMGRQLNQFVKELKQLKEGFDGYTRSRDNREKDEIHQYLSQFHQAEGGIYETNVITLLIQEWLSAIKAKSGLPNVLIIDDFDRIDPKHIFRLLNVLSSHFNGSNADEAINKFGFDQVIVVCDVDNIENIYRQQFGIKTDFNGYIDKFYSKEIYRFDNKDNIVDIIESVVQKLRLLYNEDDKIVEIPQAERLRDFTKTVLRELVLGNCMNLRALFKYYEEPIILSKKKFRILGTVLSSDYNYILSTVTILAAIVGDERLLIQKINDMTAFVLSKNDHPEHFIGEMIHLLNINISGILNTSMYPGMAHEDVNFELSSKIKYSGTYGVYAGKGGNDFMPFALLNSLVLNDGQFGFDRSSLRDQNRDWLDLLKMTFSLF